MIRTSIKSLLVLLFFVAAGGFASARCSALGGRPESVQGAPVQALLRQQEGAAASGRARASGELCGGQAGAAWNENIRKVGTTPSKPGAKHPARSKSAAAAEAAQSAIPKAEWRSFLAPPIGAFVTCLADAKARALARGSDRPSPDAFAVLLASACKPQAAAVDSAESRIADWTADNRNDLKQELEAARMRNVREYADSYHGA